MLVLVRTQFFVAVLDLVSPALVLLFVLCAFLLVLGADRSSSCRSMPTEARNLRRAGG